MVEEVDEEPQADANGSREIDRAHLKERKTPSPLNCGTGFVVCR
jgi:hypothetical protein